MFDITFDPNAHPGFTPKTLRTANTRLGTTKTRTLSVPNDDVISVHAQLIAWLRTQRKLNGPTPWITGGLPGCSPLKNVRQHAGRRYVVTMDLRNAYHNVEVLRLEDLLASRYAEQCGVLMVTHFEAAWIGSFLSSYYMNPQGGLHDGAPASPDLFNEYAAEYLDAPILALIEPYDICYTRYLDDLTFSSHRPIYPGLRTHIRAIIEAVGFTVNHYKSCNFDLERKSTVHLNGIALTRTGRTQLTGAYRHKLESLLHMATRFGNITPAVMLGHIAVFEHVVPLETEQQTSREQKVARAISAYRRSLLSY